MDNIEVSKIGATNIHGKDSGEEIYTGKKGMILICPVCKDQWMAPFPIPSSVNCKCGYRGVPGVPVLRIESTSSK